MKEVGISIVLEQESTKMDSDGNFPVSLRIYDPATRKAKRYRSGNFIPPAKLDEMTAELAPLQKRAKDIIDKLRLNNQSFSFEAFERQLKSAGGSVTLFKYLEDSAESQAKESNKRAILDLKTILEKTIVKDVHFGQINHAWLLRLEAALMRHKITGKKNKNRKLSENTVRLHLRTLRRQFNIAVEEGLAPKLETSPFIGINTQSVPAESVKRWFTIDELKTFRDYEYKQHHPNSKWRDSKNLWLFSYYSFGLNMKDILEIKWTDFQHGTLVTTRTKTGGPVTLKVSAGLQKILDYYKENKKYVFEHIRPVGDQEAKEKEHDKVLGWVTDNVKRITKQARIADPELVNFYSARHTFAVQYMQNEPNASVFKLMLYLGQTSEQSTRNYLQSLLGNEQVKAVEFMDLI